MPAGLFLASVPLPRTAPPVLSLGNRAGTALPLGQWYDTPGPAPRRLLIAADGGPNSPATLRLGTHRGRHATPAPTATMSLIEQSTEPLFMWERQALRLEWQGRAIEIAMGLTTRGETHWWEACRLITLQDLPGCRIIEMGGAIPVRYNDLRDMERHPGYKNPFLHHHNWLNGHLYIRLHANGVCEVFAHHINSRFFDDGLTLKDVVPVIGFRTGVDDPAPADPVPAKWDGSTTQLKIGQAAFDLADTARLATPQRPGRFWKAGNLLVLQPYAGVEVFGGLCPKDITGDPWIWRAGRKEFPRGMARTLRFSISLNPARSPRVARYQAPAWWYGVCEEFHPASSLPVSNAYDIAMERSTEHIRRHTVQGGFEDGALPRHLLPPPSKRHEPGWEGEIPYAQFLTAWRTSDPGMHDIALRNAYFVTDVCVDHSNKTFRMHGYKPPAVAIPMARVLGSVAGWLETGDPYLLDTARAVVETTFHIHRNSWPRQAVGRDACFARGAVLLYRYLGEDSYLRIAKETIRDVIHSQRENGTFGDQGGGTGIHQWGGYINKPWMAFMALGGVLDYLELFPEDPDATQAVKRFADWMMANRFEVKKRWGWGYQHDYNGIPQHYDPVRRKPYALPGGYHWHKDYIARLMAWCTMRSGNPDYLAAWEASHFAYIVTGGKSPSDHYVAQALQFIPRVQDWLWQAQLTRDGVVVHPLTPGDRSGMAYIATPWGQIHIERPEPGARWIIDAPRGIHVTMASSRSPS